MDVANILPDWVPPNAALDMPNAARVYDYMLGGGCNFDADREFADRLLAAAPMTKDSARHNRDFLRRAVRYCIAHGIRQFLDIGSGIPTVGNVHEIAQNADPECRVVYVDNEPIAVAHSELMLHSNDNADVLMADLTDPETILSSRPVHQLLDFGEPIAVIMTAVLHFVADEANPHGAVARYVDAMTSGSYLVLSHGVQVGSRQIREAERLYNTTSTPGSARDFDEIAAFLTGTELVEPGVVWAPRWRPDPGADIGEHPEDSLMCVAVGRKP